MLLNCLRETRRVIAAGAMLLAAVVASGAPGDVVARVVSPLTLTKVTQPVIHVGKTAPMSIELGNEGPADADPFRTMELGFSINGGEEQMLTVPIMVYRGHRETINFETPVLDVAGDNELRVRIARINDTEIENREYTYRYYGVPPTDIFHRRLFVEEFTGTWCQYCVTGILGFEYMQRYYPDIFGGIAIHADDAFSISEYQPIINRSDFHSGYPGSVANRDTRHTYKPSSHGLERMFLESAAQGAVCGLDVASFVDGDELEVNVNTRFAVPVHGADIRIITVVTEDGLEGYQSNEYTGSPWAYNGWGDAPGYRPWTFTHVARYVSAAYGVEGSLPEEIEAGETYTYSVRVPRGEIVEWENCRVIVGVIDSRTGIVLNCNFADAGDVSAPEPENPVPYTDFLVIDAEGLKLNYSEITLRMKGNSRQLRAILDPYWTTNQYIRWEASDNDLVMMSAAGDVYPTGLGTCTVTAMSHNGLTASCRVNIVGEDEPVADPVPWVDPEPEPNPDPDNGGQSGLDAIEACGDAVYYNLQGMRVENPVGGVYIEVLPGRGTKKVSIL